MKILALASFTNGTMNLPKEVKVALELPIKGRIIFMLDDSGKVYVEKG